MSDTQLSPKSNAAAVRRLEVFTGAGRRRAWSADQKGMIVAESYSLRGIDFRDCAAARIDAAAVVRLAPECAANSR